MHLLLHVPANKGPEHSSGLSRVTELLMILTFVYSSEGYVIFYNNTQQTRHSSTKYLEQCVRVLVHNTRSLKSYRRENNVVKVLLVLGGDFDILCEFCFPTDSSWCLFRTVAGELWKSAKLYAALVSLCLQDHFTELGVQTCRKDTIGENA